MPSLTRCPDQLPSELSSLLENFGRAWAINPSRPNPASHVIEHWSKLLTEWAGAEDLPLFVRKHANNRGSIIAHDSGRSLVPCDNSPAHWAYVLASQGDCPSINDIRELLAQDLIPAAMIQKTVERPIAKYHHTLATEFNVNTYGWKLAHIEGVGLKTRTPISSIPIARLKSHFRCLMVPVNMFVVPLEWGGIAELESVIRGIAQHDGNTMPIL